MALKSMKVWSRDRRKRKSYELANLEEITELVKAKRGHLNSATKDMLSSELALRQDPVFKYLRRQLTQIWKRRQGNIIQDIDAKPSMKLLTNIHELETRNMSQSKYRAHQSRVKRNAPELIKPKIESKYNPKVKPSQVKQIHKYFTPEWAEYGFQALESRIGMIQNQKKVLKAKKRKLEKEFMGELSKIPRGKAIYADVETQMKRVLKNVDKEIKDVDSQIKVIIDKRDAKMLGLELRGINVFRTMTEKDKALRKFAEKRKMEDVRKISADNYFSMACKWLEEELKKERMPKSDEGPFYFGYASVKNVLTKVQDVRASFVIVSPNFSINSARELNELTKIAKKHNGVHILMPKRQMEPEAFIILDNLFGGVIVYIDDKYKKNK